jgi:sulfite reductase (ferredoxin)
MSETEIKLAAQEQMKIDSKYLKGDILEELTNDKPDITDYAYELMKFHGSYFAFDRDTATARKKAGEDKRFEFMIRLRAPAGLITAEQYLAMDDVAERYANKTIRITTRQAIQFHVILKENVLDCMKDINKALLSTRSACGDVVRNVTTSPAPYKDAKHEKLRADALEIAEFVKPNTTAYDELWCEQPDSNRRNNMVEPLYGQTYLPRKFKIGVVVPEDNSIDVFTHDLGVVQIYEGEKFKGYNLLVGGGMGMSHEGKLTWDQKKTYPRAADPLAFIGPDDLLKAVEAVVALQRDNGDRTNRKHARLKYLVQEQGLDWTRKTFDQYFNALKPVVAPVDPVKMDKFEIPSHMGWREQGDGKWFLGVPVPSGRVVDYDIEHEAGYNTGSNKHHAGARYRTGLHDIIKEYNMDVVLTPTEEIILCDIETSDKLTIEKKLKSYGIVMAEDHTIAQLTFMACVSLPTCAKALAESERVQFYILDGFQAVLDKHDVRDEKISLRVTGCPNGCARPYVGDIGVVGRMPGHYVLFIGGDFEGTRINNRVFDKVPLADINRALDPMIEKWSTEREDGEGFGNFCQRVGVEVVAQTTIDALGEECKWAKELVQ